MPNTSLSDHVMVFDGALNPEHCLALIARFESTPEHAVSRLDDGYSFSQLDITDQWPDESKLLVPIFLSHFNRYQLALNARFWPVKFSFEHLRMKRYLPNGRDLFPLHVDVVNQAASRRFMTAIIYLNAPQGGETVFPTLDMSVTPEPGKLLAFPPLWLFPHLGLAPRSAAKYILHTYLCYPS
jgi:prolyl 4-hydroxylase